MSTLIQSPLLGVAILVAKATLLFAVGSLAAFLLRKAPAVTRHILWLSVIVGALLVPVLSRVAPVQLAVLPSVAAVATTGLSAVAAVDVATPPSPRIEPSPTAVAPRSAPRFSIPAWGTMAIGVWLTVTAGLLGWLVIGMISVNRVTRGGRLLDSSEWTRALSDAVRRLKLTATPRLVMSDQVEMPFACDPIAPTIVLPASAGEWSDDRRRAVLLHELAHVRRRDLVGHTIANVACAVYWFHPMMWVAARRLRAESELASDDVVLETGVRPSDYAEHLLDMVTGLTRGAPSIALAMARPKDFEGRLVAILDRSTKRRAIGGAQMGAIVAMLGVVTMSIAAVAPVRRVQAGLIVAPTAAPSQQSADTASRASMTRAPMRPRLDARSTKTEPALVPTLSDNSVQLLLRYGTGSIVNPALMLLRNSDSLRLTAVQADSIATLNRWYAIQLGNIWRPVSSYYLARSSGADENTIKSDVSQAARAPQATVDLLSTLGASINALLTADQREKLPAEVAAAFDPGRLSAIRAGASDALFDPVGRRGGARVGGGGNPGATNGPIGRGRSGR